MTKITNRIADLSPEKRALLTMRLKKLQENREVESGISQREDLTNYPLSFAQQRMWFLSQWDPESPFYNLPTAIKIIGDLNISALHSGLNILVSRHEVLRARFETVKGLPVQIIENNLIIDLPIVDLTFFDISEREERISKIATEESQKPFILSNEPLIRSCLIKTNQQEFVFLLTMHHIISDGWSVMNLIKELVTLYEAYTSNNENPLPELKLQYADYAKWQREWLTGDILKYQLDYWRKELTGSSQLLELPTDRPRPAILSSKGLHKSFWIQDKVMEKLTELTKQEDATLFMSLLSSFFVLLFRYSGQDDISVGTPIANRNRSEIEGLIGFFVNTLVIRSDFNNQPNFLQLLHQIKEKALGAYAHQDLPFDMLVNEMQPDRNMSHTPLFQVMFDFQANPLSLIKLSSLQIEFINLESKTSKFDLMLMVELIGKQIKGTFEFNTDLFDEKTIDRMILHYQGLLEGIVKHPERPVSSLPILSSSEMSQILYNWNETEFQVNDEYCIHELFENKAQETPFNLAVVYDENINNSEIIHSLTYSELNRQANILAKHLIKLGVGPDKLVGLCVERSLDTILGIIGILKAGGAYVPLDPSYPEERLAFILEDANVGVLVTQERLLGKLPSSLPKTICLDRDWGAMESEDDGKTSPITATKANHLAYVIYTSGSTGNPKGVMIEHRSAINLWQGLIEAIYKNHSGQPMRVSLNAPILFDASVQQWLMLLSGHTIYIIPQDVRLDGNSLLLFLRRHRINILDCVPSQLKLLLDAGIFDGSGWLPDAILPGGEAIDSSMWEILSNQPGVETYNMYGPTECTVDSTICKVKNFRQKPSIGHPIINAKCYVLDRNYLPVPVGVPGELFIGGSGVARGYLNREELTKEKFIPNPFINNDRIYKTGDLVRWLPDGEIEFMGRIDYQVKIRGFRIELGEIEAVLLQYPSVKEAVVIAREDTPGEKRLVSYVVPEQNSKLSVEELRATLKGKLPDYSIPSVFIIMDSLPLTPNGKLDRRALPVPEKFHSSSSDMYVAPSTPLEKYLAKKWQEALGIEKIGIYDNFFDLGGDSLKAAIVANSFQEVLGETTHVRALFMAPTIADLAIYMTEYYPPAVQKLGGTVESLEMPSNVEGEITVPIQKRIDMPMLDRIRKIIKPLRPFDNKYVSIKKNPRAIFVLSPPRSGSTLLRAMLAGHPGLFSPPELDLLSFNTLAERKETFSGQYSFWLEGVIRAIMDVKSCSVDEAQTIMKEFEEQDISTKEFYSLLQKWIGERILVDKTPVYSLDLEILKRAEEDFDQPFYIHLIRHPYASVYSFIEAKLDQVFFRYEHPFTQRELAELVWTISHQNILEFLGNIPKNRQIRIAFEDLVSQPEQSMHSICDLLKIDYTPAMLTPYEGKRMTDGVRPGTQMVGDFKFYLRKDIDRNAADRWKKFQMDDFLSPITWNLASEIGYEHPIEVVSRSREKITNTIRPISRDQELPLSFAQQRLWFFDQWEPGSPFYNIPSALRLVGRINIAAIERSLNEIIHRHEVLRTTFQTFDGKPVLNIKPTLSIPLPLYDLLDLSNSEKEVEYKRLSDEEAKKPFNLAEGPLIRASLIRMSRDEYIFFLTMHHIISDGWSTGVLIHELYVLYPAFSSDQVSPLTPLPIQYVDYAAWQREWLKGNTLVQQLNYWRVKLEGIPPILELPYDHPRPPVQTLNGSRLLFEIPGNISAKLRSLSRQQGTTLFMTLITAFKILLNRYSGQEDISVGTPIANRQRVELSDLIGFFVNTLVLRTDISGNPSFLKLLSRVRQVAIEAYDHQDVPFERLVDEIHPEREMSHTPLFQVMFTFQDAPISSIELPDLVLQPLQTDSGTAKFDIILSVIEKEGVFKTLWEYNSDLFERETIERMAGHYGVLLTGIVNEPDKEIGKLTILTEREKRQILNEWSESRIEVVEGKTIVEQFEDQVMRVGKRIAVRAQGISGDTQELSYEELNRKANQLARKLIRLGVSPDDLVGLYAERRVGLLVGILGILKAGGAYLPLDPNYPEERIGFILEDAYRCKDTKPIVVTVGNATETLKLKVGEVINLDEKWGELEEEFDENIGKISTEDNLAYVIYTSGSTGKPKGVMIDQKSVMNLWAGLREIIYGCKEGDGRIVSLNAPLQFDASVQQWVMVMSGETLSIIPQEVRLDGEGLVEWIRKERIEVLDCVPTQLKVMMDSGLLDDDEKWKPKAILPGGEAIDNKMWNELVKYDGVEIYNMYGPTECTVDSTICRVKEYPWKASIGKGMGNIRIYILDENGEPVAEGVPGELFIGGKGVGRGYINRDDLTDKVFIEDRFNGGKMYRTGDRVRWMNGGYLEYLGRTDHQVKVRGFRIELGEIEAVLSQYEKVKETVVVVREDNPGERHLVAYLVEIDEGKVQENQRLNVSDLRAYLKNLIPDYMIPSIYVVIEKMPLTPNGKVDRNNLPKPENQRLGIEKGYLAPRTEKEEKLAQIWAEVLGIHKVGVEDNFFELGGDSILTIQVIARANRSGMKLTPRQLFEAQTVAELALAIENVEDARAVEAEQGEVKGKVEMTPIWKWFFEQEIQESWHYNQAILLNVKAQLEVKYLRETLKVLMNHHDVLRLKFQRGEEGEWEAEIGGFKEDVPLDVVDLSELKGETRARMREEYSETVQGSLNLDRGPIFRVVYFDYGKEDPGRLLFVIHHLAVDGVSWRIILEDMQTIFQQLLNSEIIHLPPKSSSYLAWASSFHKNMDLFTSHNEVDYWINLINNYHGKFPVDYSDGDNLEKSTECIRFSLDQEKTQALLRDVSVAYGTEINDILLTALIMSYSRWSRRNQILIDLEGHGRDEIFAEFDLSRTVGWFTSIYPVFLEVEDNSSIGQTIRLIKEQIHRIPNKGIGYGYLRYFHNEYSKQLTIESPIAFNYLGQLVQPINESNIFSFSNESSGTPHSKNGKRKYILEINSSVVNNKLLFEWRFSKGINKLENIEKFGNTYLLVLNEIIDHCMISKTASYTPADFVDIDLDQNEVDNILGEIGDNDE